VIGIVAVLVIAAIAVIALQAGQQSTTINNTNNTITTSQRTSSQQAGTGQFTVLATDPPTTASGVTGAIANYNSVSAAGAGSDSSTGWV
jgi:hypothetical protein